MAEPLTLLAGVKILGKVVSAGASLYKAATDPASFDKDVKALQEVLAAGEQAAGYVPKGAAPRLAARYVMLLSSVFGATWRTHYGPRLGLDNKQEIARHQEAAVRWALAEAPAGRLAQDFSELVRSPELGPWYLALWTAFSQKYLPDPALGKTWTTPLIETLDGKDRRRFEGQFRVDWTEALASPAGRELREALLLLEDASDRASWVRGLLVADLATWGENHVFGNTREAGPLPAMPLGDMYVEPLARMAKDDKDRPDPVRQRLRDLLQKHHIVVVCADFGHGKSLTARMLALESARRYLDEPASVAAQQELPVFVKCQDAISGEGFSLARAVQQASWHQMRAMDPGGPDVRASDPALGPPGPGQQTLYLIDGLDEMGHLERGVVDLFKHVDREVVGRHRALLFSRPHALPWDELARMGVPVVEILGFDEARSRAWLDRWNQHSRQAPVAWDGWVAQVDPELLATPILLFMIAYTGGQPEIQVADEVFPKDEDEAIALRRWIQRNALYESFFRSIAWGKCEADREHHPQVMAAARHIADRLERLGFLGERRGTGDGGAGDGERARLTAAMLWLMARVAWEAHCKELKNAELKQRAVEELLEEELGIVDDRAQQIVCDGLLLAMQADLAPGRRRILFGHKSFREFLVARFWEDRLVRIVAAHDDSVQDERMLMRGRLIAGDDKSARYLLARLACWSGARRLQLHRWAERCFNNEELSIDKNRASLRGDQRLYLREAALVIGSHLVEAGGISCADPLTLRTLVCSFMARGEAFRLEAPALRHPGAFLGGLDLRDANLRGASLRGANLDKTDFRDADLREIDLGKTHLIGVDFLRANLRDASLAGALFLGTTLNHTDLRGVDLCDADVLGVGLRGTTLGGSDLRRVNLGSTDVRDIRFYDAAVPEESIVPILRSMGAVFTDEEETAARSRPLPPRGRRILIYGNSGSGKTTLARTLSEQFGIPMLDLDSIAFVAQTPVRRPLEESTRPLLDFIGANTSWVIEGCYGDLIEAALPACTELRFLNPGAEACVANCHKRPWEAQKYATKADQDSMLATLIDWVRAYATRDNDCGLARHRAIFDSFRGPKHESTEVTAGDEFPTRSEARPAPPG